MSTKKSWNNNELWAEELHKLKSLLAQTSLEATIKWGGDVYTYKGKNVLGLGGFKQYFTIWFFNGVFLTDPKQVLINAQEGKTKSLRQWRFCSMDEIDEKLILAYVKEAIEVEEKGWVLHAEKKEVIIPELLNETLKKNAPLGKSFYSLSPFKQKEYIEYIETAKQEKTKITRLEKIIPMILEGKGLNDKYRQ